MRQQLAEAEAEVEVYEQVENDQEEIPVFVKKELLTSYTSNNNLKTKITQDSVTPSLHPVQQIRSAPDKPMNCNVPSFRPQPDSTRPSPVLQQTLVSSNEQTVHSPTLETEKSQLCDSNKVILEALSLQRLPKLTPKVFEGDEMEFLRWESSFDALVASNTHDSKTMLHYLCQFLKGEPLKMVEHYQDLHHDADTAYRRAREELKYRYGNASILTASIDKRLTNWPKIGRDYNRELLHFSDFLNQVEVAMSKYTALKCFDCSREIVKLTEKLPGWAQNEWKRKVWKYKETNGEESFPPFSSFVEAMKTLARRVNMPEFGGITKQEDSRRKEFDNQRTKRNNSNRNITSFGTRVNQGNRNEESESFKEESQNRSQRKISCFHCQKDDHSLNDCKEFLALTFDQRKTFMREKRICFNCLKSTNHIAKKCDQHKPECGTCNQRHATALHDPQRHPSEPRTTTHCIRVCGSYQTTKSCAKIVLVWLRHPSVPDTEVLTYALLDDQSNAVLVKQSVFERFGIKSSPTNIRVSTVLNKEQLIAKQRKVEIGLLIGRNVPQAMKTREVVNGKDDEPWAERYDLGWTIIGDVCKGSEGNDSDETFKINRIVIRDSLMAKEIYTTSDVQRMMELDYSERKAEQGDNTIHSIEDRRFLQILEEGIKKDAEGRWEMPLPFRDETPPHLPDNRPHCVKRVMSLKRKFERDPKLFKDYAEFIKKIITKGHASRIEDSASESQPRRTWYLPHFPIYHHQKPDQIRVVFDCSDTFQQESLNKHLLQGPDLMNKLTGVLNRFRQEEIAVTCDVEQMFHNFMVAEEHRDYLRFLWFQEGDVTKPIVTYRMKVHLFGAVSSPGCANFGLRKTAQDGESEFGEEVANFVRNDFYVDDGLKSVKTIEDAVNLITKSQAMCAKAGLRLHKFASNSIDVLEAVPAEDRAKEIKDLDLRHDTLPIQRSLGTYWCIESDTFQFRITLKDKPFTRRGILSTVSSVYDPLGIVCPVILTGKLILRELVQQKADWDELVSEEIRPRWEKWRADLKDLEKMETRRCLKPPSFGEIKSTEIHSFADASQSAVGQVSYMRLVNDKDQVHVSFLTAKARVAPLKLVSIPRLELTAAVISVNVTQQLSRDLDYDVDANTYYSDSTVVLGYIQNDARRFHVYVGNRVQAIRSKTSPQSWHHVRGKENPADIASRSATPKELLDTPTWLNGPEFLWQTELPEHTSCSPLLNENDPEVRKVTVHAVHVNSQERPLDMAILNRFSSWFKLKRAIALATKYVNILRTRVSQKRRGQEPDVLGKGLSTSVLVEDLEQAEHILIRNIQQHHFHEEMAVLQSLKDGQFKNNVETRKRNQTLKHFSSLHRLDPFVDQQGIIRVGGRIKRAEVSFQEKHPVVLPKRSHLTELVIRHHHEAVQHQGRLLTLNEIRHAGYWIIHGRATVSNVINKCVKCRKQRGTSETQKMADLPFDRMKETAPFTYVGVDAFGPWHIREGRKSVKRYGIIFTCMASRAIHLETLNSMDTDSFICALRRFISRRGNVRQLRSDRGTNFIGAKGELAQAWNEMNQDHVRQFLLTKNCDWIMNVPHSSHMGGVWERQIRTVRSVISAIMTELGDQLDDETLRTLFAETENIVNSRPLTADVSDPDSPEPITPIQLLTLKSKVVLPPPGQFSRPDVYSRKRWKRVQFLANQFWQRWRREYLQSLQVRKKWQNPKRNLKVGDIVIDKDEDLPRNQWPLAKVTKTYPSDDGLVRKVEIQKATSNLDKNGKRKNDLSFFERPIHKLTMLLETVD
ncbi:uncharacterized protein LOC114536441 [Dendronephthya gigantea]|uniref:uncharacterized protein LOC114536441 n=1 Tax=Dendronephthya gigantea TaxID=151771 RepID=UPI00106D5F1C|nr:uncharacterized protein LOC114536441 [Dendronephthya gigantea]